MFLAIGELVSGWVQETQTRHGSRSARRRIRFASSSLRNSSRAGSHFKRPSQPARHAAQMGYDRRLGAHGNIAVRLAPVTDTVQPVAVMILDGLRAIIVTGVVSQDLFRIGRQESTTSHVEPTVVAHIESTKSL